MKKNMIDTACQLAARLNEWVHRVLEKKGEHIEACGWYPVP